MVPRSLLRLAAPFSAEVLLALAPACARGTEGTADAAPSVVLVVLDDFGVDFLSATCPPDRRPPPCTPNLDALVREGLLFRDVWTNPVCSPSRAQLLTGRHGFRTGIGKGIGFENGPSLRVDLETPLPRLLGRDSSAVGKWHLVSLVDGTIDHPLDAGFGYYAGSLYNLRERWPESLACRELGRVGYSNWLKTYDLDGSGHLGSRCCQTYATTDTADEAIQRARLMRPPWFLYVAFNAPHWPVHDPPRSLCPDESACERVYCREDSHEREVRIAKMTEALDTELGRMLREIRALVPNVVVFVIGDNGGEDSAEDEPESGETGMDFRGKGSLFQSGVHVPLIAAGPGVVPGDCEALVSSTDLYATIAELCGVESRAEDSVSLVPYLRGAREPLRTTVFAEVFAPNQPDAALGEPFDTTYDGRAVRDARYKLMRVSTPDGDWEWLFDLAADPGERDDLLAGSGAGGLEGEAREHYRALSARLAALGRE